MPRLTAPRNHAMAASLGDRFSGVMAASAGGYDARMTNSARIDDVPVGSETIRLGQFLKFAGLIDTGGDAKEAIIDGYVTVNGEVDRRRGRQLQEGDVVGFAGRQARVRQ